MKKAIVTIFGLRNRSNSRHQPRLQAPFFPRSKTENFHLPYIIKQTQLAFCLLSKRMEDKFHFSGLCGLQEPCYSCFIFILGPEQLLKRAQLMERWSHLEGWPSCIANETLHGYSSSRCTYQIILVSLTITQVRREYLEALLHECKKKEGAPVLIDDGLNDLIARRMNNQTDQSRWLEYVNYQQTRWLELDLKLVADIGIVGAPNARKSMFFSDISVDM
ncbi:uncharacterized protein LOC111911111 isoform X2 [Lactuca sativa]|uniref:uncharacterized protein LOC111911111 isoform X2 n=1 Tax=Lactuca sativa TaxID=4236 RepID=UPI001C69318D|nr:uncharacterized protein LOC111911111 isoform X2 [Lactuca sativa]